MLLDIAWTERVEGKALSQYVSALVLTLSASAKRLLRLDPVMRVRAARLFLSDVQAQGKGSIDSINLQVSPFSKV